MFSATEGSGLILETMPSHRGISMYTLLSGIYTRLTFQFSTLPYTSPKNSAQKIMHDLCPNI